MTSRSPAQQVEAALAHAEGADRADNARLPLCSVPHPLRGRSRGPARQRPPRAGPPPERQRDRRVASRADELGPPADRLLRAAPPPSPGDSHRARGGEPPAVRRHEARLRRAHARGRGGIGALRRDGTRATRDRREAQVLSEMNSAVLLERLQAYLRRARNPSAISRRREERRCDRAAATDRAPLHDPHRRARACPGGTRERPTVSRTLLPKADARDGGTRAPASDPRGPLPERVSPRAGARRSAQRRTLEASINNRGAKQERTAPFVGDRPFVSLLVGTQSALLARQS